MYFQKCDSSRLRDLSNKYRNIDIFLCMREHPDFGKTENIYVWREIYLKEYERNVMYDAEDVLLHWYQ